MKTPEEIKRRLELCSVESGSGTCKGCPYIEDEECISHGNRDDLEYIRQLEEEIDRRMEMSKMDKYERLMKGLWHMYNEAGGMIGSYIDDDGVRVSWKIELNAPPEKVDVLIKAIELVADIAAMKAEDEGVI